MQFVAMTASDEDLGRYTEFVCRDMDKDDVYTAADFAPLLDKVRVRAWRVSIDRLHVGWCALSPWHNMYADHDWHLFGGWVHPDWRRRGIFKAMWRFRLELIPPDASVTVSIQPDKLASLKLAEENGFSFLRHAPPWDIYFKAAQANL